MSSTNYRTAVSMIGQQYIFADQLLNNLKTETYINSCILDGYFAEYEGAFSFFSQGNQHPLPLPPAPDGKV